MCLSRTASLWRPLSLRFEIYTGRLQHTPSHTWVVLSSCREGITSCNMRTERRTRERRTSGPRTGIWRNKSQRREGKCWEKKERERKWTSGCNTALEGLLHLAICNVYGEAHQICVVPRGWTQILSCKTTTWLDPKPLTEVSQPSGTCHDHVWQLELRFNWRWLCKTCRYASCCMGIIFHFKANLQSLSGLTTRTDLMILLEKHSYNQGYWRAKSQLDNICLSDKSCRK